MLGDIKRRLAGSTKDIQSIIIDRGNELIKIESASDCSPLLLKTKGLVIVFDTTVQRRKKFLKNKLPYIDIVCVRDGYIGFSRLNVEAPKSIWEYPLVGIGVVNEKIKTSLEAQLRVLDFIIGDLSIVNVSYYDQKKHIVIDNAQLEDRTELNRFKQRCEVNNIQLHFTRTK